MIEKVTLQLSGDADFTSEGGPRCEEMNPKTLLLYAAAKCVGKTALMIMDKERSPAWAVAFWIVCVRWAPWETCPRAAR